MTAAAAADGSAFGVDVAGEYVEVERRPCPSCGRCFAPAALRQHARVCDKVFRQKRKVRQQDGVV